MAYCVNGCWSILSNAAIGTDDFATYHPAFMSPSLNIVGSRPGINLENTSGTLNTIRLKGTAAAGEMHINFDGSSCTAGSLSFYTYGCANRQTLTLGLNGNVGVGTSSPLTLFHVNSSTDNLTTFQAGSGYGVQLRFRHGSSLTGFINSNTTNIFSIFDGSSNELISLSSGGKFGIGTSTPDAKLHICNAVAGGTNNYVIIVQNCCTVADARAGIAFSNNSQTPSAGGLSGASIQTSNNGIDGTGNLLFGTLSSGTNTERMRISYDGKVGIGTSSPNAMLQVAGNFTLSGGTRCILGDGGDLLIDTENVSGRDIILQSNSGQKVGVGTISPSYRLHVNGTFYAAGSSQDYKQSICNYNTDSCLFMCLKPKTYQYKDEWKHLGKELKSETQIGLIAEEVAESHPELAILVNEEDNKVVRNVDYEKLSIILLSELQKLRQEVDQLKNK